MEGEKSAEEEKEEKGGKRRSFIFL